MLVEQICFIVDNLIENGSDAIFRFSWAFQLDCMAIFKNTDLNKIFLKIYSFLSTILWRMAYV